MLVLIAKYHVKVGKTDDVLAELAKMKPMVEANEPGCKCYQVSRSRDDDRLVILYEQYDDEDALSVHRGSAHFKSIIEDTVVPMLESRDREFYELVIP